MCNKLWRKQGYHLKTPSQPVSKCFLLRVGKSTAKLDCSLHPAPVSCLDRVQTCHLRRRGRTRSLPFSCFRPVICSSWGNAVLGQLSSLQAAACKELPGVLTKIVGCSFLPFPLSGKTRHPRPRPNALGLLVAVKLGPGQNLAWTCAN